MKTEHPIVAHELRGDDDVLTGETKLVPSGVECAELRRSKSRIRPLGEIRILVSLQYESRNWFAWCDSELLTSA